MERFQDRETAGRELATSLAHLADKQPVVVGLARGGVVVAAQVAAALNAPLEVLVARKIAAPSSPEFGIGAVAPGGISVFDDAAVRYVHLSEDELKRITTQQLEEVERRLSVYRAERPLEIRDRCVILVDDGLATGITAVASCRYARSLNPTHLVFAVPVTSWQGAARVRPEVDEFIALERPDFFQAVGAWYGNFEQTTDEQVLELLNRSRDNPGGSGATLR